MTRNSGFVEKAPQGISEVLRSGDAEAYYESKHQETLLREGRHAAEAASIERGHTLIVMSPWTGEHMTNEAFTEHIEERKANAGRIAAESLTPVAVEATPEMANAA